MLLEQQIDLHDTMNMFKFTQTGPIQRLLHFHP